MAKVNPVSFSWLAMVWWGCWLRTIEAIVSWAYFRRTSILFGVQPLMLSWRMFVPRNRCFLTLWHLLITTFCALRTSQSVQLPR